MSNIRLLLGGRRTGRTTEMIEWLIEGEPNQKRVIASHSVSESNRLYAIAQERCPTVERWQFHSVGQGHIDLVGRDISAIGIDNLELVLSRLAGGVAPVGMVAGTLAQDTEYGPQRGFVLELDSRPQSIVVEDHVA